MNVAFVLLASVLLIDALLSVKPPAFIRHCLTGVGFPRDWWWTLIVIKLLAVAGLISGVWAPELGIAATVGVITYFLCALTAHIRARFFGSAFWLNCIGMFFLAVGTLVFAVL